MSERFDLIDQTQVVTQPFTQDLVSYAAPRPAVGGALGAAFPITPSRNFTIQELMIGVVRLDVTPFAGDGTRIGARTGRRNRRQCRRRRVAGSGRGACRQRSGHAAARDGGRRRHRRARRFRSDCGHTDRHGRRRLHGRRTVVDVCHRRPHDPGPDSRRARVHRPVRPATSQGRRRRRVERRATRRADHVRHAVAHRNQRRRRVRLPARTAADRVLRRYSDPRRRRCARLRRPGHERQRQLSPTSRERTGAIW